MPQVFDHLPKSSIDGALAKLKCAHDVKTELRFARRCKKWIGGSVWRIDEKSVKDLIALINEGNLALPQFQRDEVWGKGDWLPFLRTILLQRPTGTLLLLESGGARALAPRPLETAPPISSKVQWLLLDGQQRTTTLYRAASTSFDASSPKRIVIRVKDALQAGNLLEEHVELRRQGDVGDYVAMARAGEIDFLTLLDVDKRETWRYTYIMTHYDETDERSGEYFSAQLRQVIPGLMGVADYRFPILAVNSDTPLSVVAEIFEGMNRRGQQLNTFDLMVARLYQPLNSSEPDGPRFDLRERWDTELTNSQGLQQLGVSVNNGMLPLQLIAQQVSRNRGIRGKVLGLNSSDVLELKPAQVIGSSDADVAGLNLTTAVQALNEAAEFLAEHCGVVTSNLLPQQAMLLPIADQMLRPVSKRLENEQIKRWFFAVGLAGEYYGSVNSYAATHCEELFAWAEVGQEPARMKEFSRSFVNGLNLRQEFRRDGNILGRTIMAFLVQIGAYDWNVTQSKLVRQCDPIDFHHVVPEARLKALKLSKSDQRPIAGMTPISKSANARIRKENPKTVLLDMGGHADPIMSSHLIGINHLAVAYESKSKYEAFCSEREASLKRRLLAFLGL